MTCDEVAMGPEFHLISWVPRGRLYSEKGMSPVDELVAQAGIGVEELMESVAWQEGILPIRKVSAEANGGISGGWV
jgi:hypothetical protein